MTLSVTQKVQRNAEPIVSQARARAGDMASERLRVHEIDLPLHDRRHIDRGQYFYTNPTKSKLVPIVSDRGFIQTSDIRIASFIWFQDKQHLKKVWSDKIWREIKPWQTINHLEKEREMGHKGRLLHHLHNFFGGPGKIPFMPTSYRLWDPQERMAFLSAIEEDTNGHKFHPWIMKEAHKDNGQGIKIISKQADLSKLRGKLMALPKNADGSEKRRDKMTKSTSFVRHLIAQHYLLRPTLTADGHKFDLRMYWLVASVSPLVVFYHDGYMRVSMSRYSENDFKLRTALTNAKVAKEGINSQGMHDYEASKESTRRPFSELGNLVGGEEELNALRCKIQKALSDVVQATRVPIFDHAAKKGCTGCFSLMGADFMVAGNDVYMSEVQSGPGLPTTTSTTRTFFNDILPNTIDLMLEVHDRRQSGLPLWPLLHRGGFKLIVHDGSSEVERSAVKMPACQKNSARMQVGGWRV